MDIAQPVPHSYAIRSLVQSLTGDAGMTGLELIRGSTWSPTPAPGLPTSSARPGLSGPRWILLFRLLAEERSGCGEGVSPTHLSQRQNVSKNTISVLLRGLEEQGLIERSLVPDDRRAFHIHLTDVGRTLVETTAPADIAFLNEMTAGLTPRKTLNLLTCCKNCIGRCLQGTGRQGTGDRGQGTGDRGQGTGTGDRGQEQETGA